MTQKLEKKARLMHRLKTGLISLTLLIQGGAVVAAPAGTVSGKVELTEKAKWLVSMRGYENLHRPPGEKVPDPSLQDGVAFLDRVPGRFAPPALNAVFHIKGPVFVPRTMPVLQGTRVVFANDDLYDHSLRSLATLNPSFSRVLAPKGLPFYFRTQAPEEFTVVSEEFLSSACHILVLQNPFFARLEKEGTFVIRNVPPGVYTLRAWHPDFETTQAGVTVQASREIASNLLFEKAR